MSWALPFACWLLLLLALLGVVVTALPAVSGGIWWMRHLGFPRLDFLIAMAVVGLLAVLPRRTWLNWVAVAALAGACAYVVFLVGPYNTFVAPQQVAAAFCPDGNRLRLLEVNAQMTNRHDHRLLDIVRRADPDVAWFQETDAW